MPEFTMDERGLGRTIAALMQFMERELGKDVSCQILLLALDSAAVTTGSSSLVPSLAAGQQA